MKNNILYINKDMLFDYNNLTSITGTKVQPSSFIIIF
jgi:hypothetical protein